jgi:shikimate kinase
VAIIEEHLNGELQMSDDTVVASKVNIYLAGLIGAGKTTVGWALAQRLGWSFHDLDVAMREDAGKDFRQVVAEEGWLGFRVREYRICKRFAGMDRVVVGLGGGTVRYEWNRDLLRGTGANVLLHADLGVIADRVRPNDRPRVHPGTTLEEDLALIWNDHKDLYLGWADHVYMTDQGKSVQDEVDDLIELLERDGGLPAGSAPR